jgi:SSS family solute:Na+ symporter
LGAVASGLIGLVYFTDRNAPLADPETVFLLLGDILFHPFITGVILAAVLAAIMSTISSQLIVCSSSITKDFYMTFLNKKAAPKQQMLVSRLAVLIVAAVATIFAIFKGGSIVKLTQKYCIGNSPVQYFLCLKSAKSKFNLAWLSRRLRLTFVL